MIADNIVLFRYFIFILRFYNKFNKIYEIFLIQKQFIYIYSKRFLS